MTKHIANTVLVWRLFGFKLAFPTAHHGTDVTWIGGRITIPEDKVSVAIPEEMLHFFDLVTELLRTNVIAVRKVRILASTANHFASLVYIWLHSGLRGCVWIKQMKPALLI